MHTLHIPFFLTQCNISFLQSKTFFYGTIRLGTVKDPYYLNKSSRSAILNSQGTPCLSMLGSALYVHYRPGRIVPNIFFGWRVRTGWKIDLYPFLSGSVLFISVVFTFHAAPHCVEPNCYALLFPPAFIGPHK